MIKNHFYQNKLPLDYGGFYTRHNAEHFHLRDFANYYNRYRRLKPSNLPNAIRLRQYNVSMFVDFWKGITGGFLPASISYGVALGANNSSKNIVDIYNTDINFVPKRYPNNAPIKLQKGLIPDFFPFEGLEKLAFTHLNITNELAESFPISYP